MKQIVFTESIDGFKTGEVTAVENNVAHRYIDGGFARLATIAEYSDRMMGGKNKGGRMATK